MTKVGKDFFDKVKFKQRSEGSEGANYADRREEHSMRRNTKTLKNGSKENLNAYKELAEDFEQEGSKIQLIF